MMKMLFKNVQNHLDETIVVGSNRDNNSNDRNLTNVDSGQIS